MSAPVPQQGRVLVIGSLNVDLVMHTQRLPRPGETVTGATFQMAAGGKGANQAVAAARLGAAVAMIGRTGTDAAGQLVRAELARAGVDLEHVQEDATAATGAAQIVVDGAGQNTIVVASGANERLEAADVLRATTAWDRAALVVMQLEIPLTTVTAALAMARQRGLPVLLNAAPAQPLASGVLSAIDWLIVNEVEAAQLLSRDGAPIRSINEACAAAKTLQQPGQYVAVTLGPLGAVLAGVGEPLHVSAPRIDVVDTTAAGDAVVGALAVALQQGQPPAQALRTAVIAGSLACTRAGAIPSLPTAAELEAIRTRLIG